MAGEGVIQNLLESDIELKSSILNLDIAKDFNFFKKDLVLGNIDAQEKRFLDVVFDLISDIKHFANIIIERQYAVMSIQYNQNGIYKTNVDNEVKKYNNGVIEVIKKLKEASEKEGVTEEEKEQHESRIGNIRKMTQGEYLMAAAKHEGLIAFFDGASEKLIILAYGKLALSRAKGGYQQKMLLTKQAIQKYTDLTGKKGGLFGFGKKKEEQ